MAVCSVADIKAVQTACRVMENEGNTSTVRSASRCALRLR